MSYRLRFAAPAKRYFDRLDNTTQDRIAGCLDQIIEDPYNPRTKALAYPRGYRSARIGRWRIVFMIDTQRQVVDVVAIGPRGQVYRGL